MSASEAGPLVSVMFGAAVLASIPVGVVLDRTNISDRGDASEDVLEKHYDKAGNRERARRRQEHIPEDV